MALYTDLQAYYPLNGNANDYLGINNGTATGTVTWPAGNFGDSAALSNTTAGNYINAGMAAVSFTGGFTVSGWYNNTVGWAATAPYGVQDIVGKDGVDNTREWKAYIQSGIIGCACYNLNGARRIARTAPAPADGVWYHAVFTYDGGTASSGIKIYINGTQVDNADDNLGPYPGMTAPTNTVKLGQYGPAAPPLPAGDTLRFSGQQDDVAIWTRELTAAEVLAIYTAGNAGNPLSSLLGPSDLQGQFSSVVHSVAGADADLQGMFSSVVHSVAAADADLQGMFSSVVHSATVASRADLQGQFSSVVHSVAAADADLQGQWISIVHNDVPPPSGGGPSSQGEVMQGGALQGNDLQGRV